MNAVVLEKNRVLKYKEIPAPEVHPGTVRIRVMVCGICGSDIPRVFDYAAHSYPQILGHEFSGIIDSIGSDVLDFKVGQKVVVAPLVPCHQCDACKCGNYALCKQYSFIGSRQQGAMADFVVVPAKNVISIPESISFEEAATIEPATVSLHALRQSHFQKGKSVAIIGCGIIGLYMIQWVQFLGASYIAVIGRGEKGIETANSLGTDICVSINQLEQKNLLEQFPNEGFDYVLECSGSEQAIQMALQLVAKKGTICCIGTPKKPLTMPVNLWEQVNRKECWLTGSWMSYSAPFPGEEWRTAISAMENRKLKPVPNFIYKIYPMKEAEKAFQEIYDGQAKGRVLLSNLSNL